MPVDPLLYTTYCRLIEADDFQSFQILLEEEDRRVLKAFSANYHYSHINYSANIDDYFDDFDVRVEYLCDIPESLAFICDNLDVDFDDALSKAKQFYAQAGIMHDLFKNNLDSIRNGISALISVGKYVEVKQTLLIRQELIIIKENELIHVSNQYLSDVQKTFKDLKIKTETHLASL